MHISYNKYRVRNFAEDYERVNPRPVIIKGWMPPKLKMELSLYNLQKKYGNLKIEVENGKKASSKTLSLQDYITSIINNEDEGYYLSNWQYHTQFPHLDTLYRRPKFFRDNWFSCLKR